MRFGVLFFIWFLSACSTGMHGNFCGAGYPAEESIFDDPNGIDTAVDWLDRVCFKHDKCYKDAGFADCSCDQAFFSEVISGSQAPWGLQWNIRPTFLHEEDRQSAFVKATVFSAYFASTVCVPRDLKGVVEGNNVAKLFLSEYFKRLSDPVAFDNALRNEYQQSMWQEERRRESERQRCSAIDRAYGYCRQSYW